jgi:peroxin-5
MQIDPKDLDTLLSLGVSCTNILDEVHAMNHMKNWMLNNEKYKDVPLDPNLINEEALTGQLTVEQIKDINTKLIDLFEMARQKNHSDPDLLVPMPSFITL